MYGFVAKVMRETAKAIRVKALAASEDTGSDVLFWLPKSQIDTWADEAANIFVEVPEWLARKDDGIALAIECDCGVNPIAADMGAYRRYR